MFLLQKFNLNIDNVYSIQYKQLINPNLFLLLFSSYNKYTIFHDNEEAFQYMVDLQTQEVNLDFWLLSRNMSVVSVSPLMQPIFEKRLHELGVTYQAKPLMEEMELFNQSNETVTCEGSECEHSRTRRQARGFFTHFPRYSEVRLKDKH